MKKTNIPSRKKSVTNSKIRGAERVEPEQNPSEQEIQTLLKSAHDERDRLSAVINSIQDEVWFADTAKNLRLANPSALRAFGLEAAKLTTVDDLTKIVEVYRPDGTIRPDHEAPVIRALEGEVIRNEESISRATATGELRHRQVSAAPVRDANGSIIGSVAVVRDITDQKRAEKQRERLLMEVEEARRRFEAVVENSPVGICVWRGPDLVYEQANPAYHMFAPGKRFLGRTYAETWPEALEPFMSIIRKVMDTGEPYYGTNMPVRIKRDPDGPLEEGFFNIFYSVLPPDASGLKGVLNIAVETTEQVRAQESLRESEERFRVAQELSPDGFTILRPVRDAQGHVVDFKWVYENAAIARLNGTDPKVVVGRGVSEFLPGHRGSPFHEIYQQVAETGESRVLEAPYQGDSIPVLTWFRVAVVAMGEDIAVLAQDITERKRAERLNQAIADVDEVIHSTLSSNEVMKIALEKAREAIGCETAAISLREGNRWLVSYVLDFPESSIGTYMSDEEEPHAVLAIETRKAVAINDALTDPRVNCEHRGNGAYGPF